jgi:hypothetical protein
MEAYAWDGAEEHLARARTEIEGDDLNKISGRMPLFPDVEWRLFCPVS